MKILRTHAFQITPEFGKLELENLPKWFLDAIDNDLIYSVAGAKTCVNTPCGKVILNTFDWVVRISSTILLVIPDKDFGDFYFEEDSALALLWDIMGDEAILERVKLQYLKRFNKLIEQLKFDREWGNNE